MFTVAYAAWFMTVFYIDRALRKADKEAPEEVWVWAPRSRPLNNTGGTRG
jgi:hypothetical protein